MIQFQINFLIGLLVISHQGVLETDAAFSFSDVLYATTNLLSTFYDIPYTTRADPLENYDFIVIGSGAAGATVANRLSENSTRKILLLEAGSAPNHLSTIPYYAVMFQVTPYSWGYATERQDGICEAMEDNRCAWPRGKALGGTTAIDYMIYSRGTPMDYDKWAAQGNVGWSYEEVLPYFLKSENCHLGETCGDGYHSTDGPVSIEYGYESEFTRVFAAAGEELGFTQVDYNSKDFMGFSEIQSTQKRGRRDSAKSAFLDPISDRTNLDIFVSARVTKILIDPTTKIAQGVEFYYKNEKRTATATKEVIVSAGTFHSPQLLMLSGVGPKAHLQEFGISVIKDLPVGETLYDHISYPTAFYIINKTEENILQQFNPLNWVNWFINGEGLLTSNSGVDNVGYIRTNISDDVDGYPDLKILLLSFGGMNYDKGLVSRPELRVRQEIYDEYIKPLERVPTYTILPTLIHPKSKGYIKLGSANPFDPPKLYGNYYTDPDNHDLKTMIMGIRFAQRLAKTEAFQKLGAKEYDKHFPGCEKLDYNTDAYWECALRKITVSMHNQVATCKMGPENDAGAVVDSRLRVYGIKNLRVADSSIIPRPLSGHGTAPSTMIGEKLGDILKEDWRNL